MAVTSNNELSPIQRIALGVCILIAGIANIALIISMWWIPFFAKTDTVIRFNTLFGQLSQYQTTFLLVFLAGMQGAFLHMATSFGYHCKNGPLTKRSSWWYLLRMPIGGTLGLMVVGALITSVFSSNIEVKSLNIIGLLTISSLSGMFSKQAIDKLADVFDTMFAKRESDKSENTIVKQGEETE